MFVPFARKSTVNNRDLSDTEPFTVICSSVLPSWEIIWHVLPKGCLHDFSFIWDVLSALYTTDYTHLICIHPMCTMSASEFIKMCLWPWYINPALLRSPLLLSFSFLFRPLVCNKAPTTKRDLNIFSFVHLVKPGSSRFVKTSSCVTCWLLITI